MNKLQSTIYSLFLFLTGTIVMGADGDILPTEQTNGNGGWDPYGTIHPSNPSLPSAITPGPTINNTPSEEEIKQQNEQAIEQGNEENGTKHNNAGTVAFDKGKWKVAIAEYERALSYEPEDELVKRNLNRARAMQKNDEGKESLWNKKYESAINNFQYARQLYPENSTIAENVKRAQSELAELSKRKAADSQALSEIRSSMDNLNNPRPDLGGAFEALERIAHQSGLAATSLSPEDMKAKAEFNPGRGRSSNTPLFSPDTDKQPSTQIDLSKYSNNSTVMKYEKERIEANTKLEQIRKDIQTENARPNRNPVKVANLYQKESVTKSEERAATINRDWAIELVDTTISK
jgi:hypothetical protein